jgi:NADH-quinone oxidoreductase subunit G
VRRGAKVFGIGPEVDLTYKVEWLGDDLKLLGKLPDAIAKAERPVMIVGPGALAAGGQGAALAASSTFVKSGWNGFNVLHTSASRMAGLMLGYAQKGGLADIVAAKPSLVILLGADEVASDSFKGAFTVYIGHHGDKGAASADLVLPAAAYSEKHGTFVNLEGRVQRSERATFPPGDAREDWTIFRALSDLIGDPLPFDRFDQLRAAMIADTPALGQDGIVDFGWSPPKLAAKASGPVKLPILDFYLTNAICRASPTMRRCSEELVHGVEFAEAAE